MSQKTNLLKYSTIVGIIFSYFIIGCSNNFIEISDVPKVSLAESVGNSFFQISHVLLFASIYLRQKINRFNKLLLIPIIVQLVDLVPIELLHSLRFSIVSTLSIIIGWVIVIANIYPTKQKKFVGLISLGVICLIISLIPGLTILTSLSNPNGGILQFGVKVFGVDNFKLNFHSVVFNQLISISTYSILSIYNVAKIYL